MILQSNRCPEDRHDAVAGETADRAAVPLNHTAARLTSSAMISRNRSGPTAAAMSIESTTSANNTVTCLYSADWVACATGVPHSLQNLAVAPNCVPHDLQERPAAIGAPMPSPESSTSVSCHRWLVKVCHIGPAIRSGGAGAVHIRGPGSWSPTGQLSAAAYRTCHRPQCSASDWSPGQVSRPSRRC